MGHGARTSASEETGQNAIPGRPWHAYGLAAGLLAASVLALGEWWLIRGQPESALEGTGDVVRYLATTLTVYGFVTLPLGLGFGLALAGFARWLNLPRSWQRLAREAGFRRQHEAHLAGLVALLPLAILSVAATAFFVQKSFVRNMNNPTLGGAFLALSVIVALVAAVALSGVGVVVLGGLLRRLRVGALARREPRLLRATIWLVLLGALAVLAAAFLWLYDPLVWPTPFVIFLFATPLLPVLLTLSGPLIRWARFLRSPPALASLLLAYMALSAWTFTGLNRWEGPRFALFQERHTERLAPSLAVVIHKITDRDGDGESALLGGGDCDDGNPDVYTGAAEVPGNGIDDNCLGGDAAPRPDEAAGDSGGSRGDASATAEGTGALAEGTGGAAEGSGQAVEEGPPPDPRKNIVFILVDTLRPDHLGFFGYTREVDGQPRSLSPRMDAFAADSLVFTHTYAQAPHTPRSIPSILTSRHPSRIDFRNPNYNYPILRDDNLTLFEALDELGYYNLAVTSHYYFEPDKGTHQGFDEFDNRGALSIRETNTVSAAPDIYAHLEEHIDDLVAVQQREGEYFSLFIHYYEPHSRWMPHPDVIDFGDVPRGLQRHINHYDSEIAMVDIYVGRTLDLLEENGLLEDTIALILSDHGEEFDDHGDLFHGKTLYNEVIHVPFFLRVPGYEPGLVEDQVALIDVAPTLVDLVGGEVPPAFEGQALFRDWPHIEPRDIVSELLPYSNFEGHFIALIRGDLKAIYNVRRRRYELYDLAVDPREQDNIYRESDRAEEMRAAIIGWLEQ